jgi:type I restriction enzyme R subunit
MLADPAYRNTIKNSDRQNARIEHDRALQKAITDLVADHTELFKQVVDNASFKEWLTDRNFEVTYQPPE